MVTVEEKTLRGETDRAGITEFGTSVSAGQLRGLACNAAILPAVMKGQSHVLDQGRAKRHHTAAQRIAPEFLIKTDWQRNHRYRPLTA